MMVEPANPIFNPEPPRAFLGIPYNSAKFKAVVATFATSTTIALMGVAAAVFGSSIPHNQHRAKNSTEELMTSIGTFTATFGLCIDFFLVGILFLKKND